MVTNGTLAAVKIAAGVIGHSYALVADGIESLNDLFSSGVVLLALRVSAKPADADHPYGHGKAEQLGALFSAISILAAGGEEIGYGIDFLRTDIHVEQSRVDRVFRIEEG